METPAISFSFQMLRYSYDLVIERGGGKGNTGLWEPKLDACSVNGITIAQVINIQRAELGESQAQEVFRLSLGDLVHTFLSQGVFSTEEKLQASPRPQLTYLSEDMDICKSMEPHNRTSPRNRILPLC